MTPAVVLVGPPGAGKSTVGRLVAGALGVEFRDTDDDVEAAAGKSVSDIFIEDGEEAFRALERSAVAQALAAHAGVLSVGGGAVLDSGTRQNLAGHRVVWLSVGLTDASSRVGFATSRPLLVVNPRAELKRLLDERREFYAEVAGHTIETDGRSPDEVAADVVAWLTSDGAEPA
jgi:shikimate kinase